MKAIFENTKTGDRITLCGTLCEVGIHGAVVEVAIVSTEQGYIHTPEEFDSAGYQHVKQFASGDEIPVPSVSQAREE